MPENIEMGITAVVITFNEERNIARCLNALHSVVDEIVVLDSFSTDNTEIIAKSFPKVKFYAAKWLGYSASKNYANSLSSNNWILSLDADEELSDQLANSIRQWKLSNIWKPAGFNRLTNYCGQWIYHCGWYPDFKFRIFNRQEFLWKGDIHEVLTKINGKEEKPMKLEGNCLHYSYYTAEEHWNQTEKFSKLWAAQAFKTGKKYSVFKRWFGPGLRFIRDYLIKAGFMDGSAGFKICRVSSLGVAMRQKFLLDQINQHQ